VLFKISKEKEISRDVGKIEVCNLGLFFELAFARLPK
jgi:hypothetical protein